MTILSGVDMASRGRPVPPEQLVPVPLAEHGGPLAFMGARQVERFWSKVDCSAGPGACWPWTGQLDREGYGKFQITTGWRPGSGRPPQIHVKAARVAFALSTGAWPTLYVLHSCPGGDLRACCNPAHLREGTQRENIGDMDRRGRRGTKPLTSYLRGEAHPRATITAEQARRIKEMVARGERPCVIARAVGVRYGTVINIKTGNCWSRPQ